MSKKHLTGLAMASLLATGLAGCANGGALFEAKPMKQGYQNDAKTAEAKCGAKECKSADATCGGKTAQGSCGADKAAQGACGAKTDAKDACKTAEGKCGEGKCGSK